MAGVTTYRGDDHPLRHLARRMYRLKGPSAQPVEVEDVAVTMGSVAREDRTIGARGAAWVKAAYAGGADFICLGMFDFQVQEDVALTCKAIAEATNRKRRWF